MYVRTRVQTAVKLAVMIASVMTIAACDRAATEPDAARAKRAMGAARHDDIEGDTTGCKNGWVVVTGHYVCV